MPAFYEEGGRVRNEKKKGHFARNLWSIYFIVDIFVCSNRHYSWRGLLVSQEIKF